MKSRRTFLIAGALAMLLLVIMACAPAATQEAPQPAPTEAGAVQPEATAAPVEGFPDGTELHILQWSHFVPRYDEWFDQFAADWGDANNVDVTVDHIDLAQLIPSLTASIDAGEGPTMVELIIAPSLFVEGLRDLTDVNMEAQQRFGEPAPTCVANSYLPANDMWYGYCHGWVPDPGDYDQALWSSVGMPDGPSTWQDLLEGGAQIRDDQGVPMGLGLSPEIDSNMAMRAIIWSFGGSIQDENENVVINSPEVLEAVNYVKDLYEQTMTDEVFSWNAASNNQGLIAGELSYILNSISAYRSLQKIDEEAANNIGFVPALKGPRGDQHASAHVWQVYVVPDYVEDGPEFDAAKAFMLHLTENYSDAVYNSELYNFPTFKSTAPQLFEEGGWLDNDPFGSQPPDKLNVLRTAEDWVTHLGYPGPGNPAVAEVYNTNVITTMMGQAARGEVTPEEAIAQAESEINTIFEKWRERGLVGGGQ